MSNLNFEIDSVEATIHKESLEPLQRFLEQQKKEKRSLFLEKHESSTPVSDKHTKLSIVDSFLSHRIELLKKILDEMERDLEDTRINKCTINLKKKVN